MNRIQRLRKKAGLNSTDDVLVKYKLIKDNCSFETMIDQNKDLIIKTTKYPVEAVGSDATAEVVIVDEEQQINDTVFNLQLLKL